MNPGERKIIHIDMDCFYAAIECRDDVAVRGKPVGVGGSSGRGVLTTCNYEARAFGCRSAMPVFKAKELCPEIIIKPVRFDVYRRESQKIRKIFKAYTEQIEPLSLDEAYLDVSHLKETAWRTARAIRSRIWEETGLTASAGISVNKMLAKIASDWNKPNGQYAILPDEIDVFMKTLPVRKIPGVGKRAEAILKENGIETCDDLQKADRFEMGKWLGPSWAEELWQRCRGIDLRPVETKRIRRSLSVERTFSRNLESLESCRKVLPELLSELQTDLKKGRLEQNFAKIFLKLKFANFQNTTKERVASEINENIFHPLLEEAFHRSPHAVRLIGVGVRFKESDEHQLSLALD